MFNTVYDIGVITDIGNVRKINQDNVLVLRGSIGKDECSLLVVADGMGGLLKGELASQIVVEMFKSWWDKDFKEIVSNNINLDIIKNSIEVTIENINREIHSFQENNIKTGTTLCLVFIYKKQYIMCCIGDSRIYLVNKNKLAQISVDHTWCEGEIAAGRMERGDELNHKMRGVLTSALGVNINYTLQSEVGILENDYILLCTDGFYSYLNENNLFQYIKKYKDSQIVLENAKKEILSKGANDNLTAVLLNAKRKFV